MMLLGIGITFGTAFCMRLRLWNLGAMSIAVTRPPRRPCFCHMGINLLKTRRKSVFGQFFAENTMRNQ